MEKSQLFEQNPHLQVCQHLSLLYMHVGQLFASICKSTLFTTPWLVVFIGNITSRMANSAKIGQTRSTRLRGGGGCRNSCSGGVILRCRIVVEDELTCG